MIEQPPGSEISASCTPSAPHRSLNKKHNLHFSAPVISPFFSGGIFCSKRREPCLSFIRPKSCICGMILNPQSFLASSSRINCKLRHCSPHNPIVACSLVLAGISHLLLMLLLLRRRLALLLRDEAPLEIWSVLCILLAYWEKTVLFLSLSQLQIQ